jgi:transcriptional regulator with XRE-family HTH domain
MQLVTEIDRNIGGYWYILNVTIYIVYHDYGEEVPQMENYRDSRFPELARWMNQQRFIFETTVRRGRGTIEDFAQYVGISGINMGRYLEGKQMPSEKTVNKIAEKLGTEIYAIVGMSERMPDNPMLVEMVRGWKFLTKDEQKNLLDEFRAKTARRREAEHKTKSALGGMANESS